MMTTLMAEMPPGVHSTVARTNICYYQGGEGDVILLLHGWPQTSYVWRKVFPELSKHYRVIAIDLPGLGNSDSTEHYDTKAIAKMILTFIQGKESQTSIW